MQNHPKTRIFFQGLVILLALWGGLFHSCRRAEPEQVTYAFTVIVTDESSHPFEGALVQVDKKEKYTDKEGKCSFEGLKDTRLHVVVSAQYYHTIDQIYGLEGREDPTLRVTLIRETPSLSVDNGQFDTPFQKSHGILQIQANTDWRIESSSEALSFSTREGLGSKTVYVDWSFPDDGEEDISEASFTIHSSAGLMTIPVRYHHPQRIVRIETIVPNSAVDRNAPAIGRMTFSRKAVPVQAWGNSLITYEMRRVDDYTIDLLVPHNIFNLGQRKIIDHVQVKAAGDDVVMYDDAVQLDFFDDIAYLEGGEMEDIWLSPDETYMWVTTILPNRVYKLDTRDFSVLKSFDLDWRPWRVCYNLYNNRLYVVDYNHGVLNVLDPDTGAQLKTISKEPDELDHPQYPTNMITKALFADNGLGVLITDNDGRMNYRWFLIDSRRDDIIEHTPLEQEYGTSFSDYCFFDAMLDHTRTKIIGKYWYNFTLYMLDSIDGSISPIEVQGDFNAPGVLYAGGQIQQQRTHREKDLMMYCAPFSSVLHDYVNDTYSQPFVNHPFWQATCDFCYGEEFGDDLCTYFVNWNNSITIYNHSQHTVPFGTYFGRGGSTNGSEGILSFRRGGRLIIYYSNGNDRTVFLTINTSRFTT